MDASNAARILRRLGVQVLGENNSGWLRASCPLSPWTHARGRDYQPSFGVKVGTETSYYHCFTCHSHGRLSTLVRILHHNGEPMSTDSMGEPLLAREADKLDSLAVVGSGDWQRDRELETPEPLVEEAYDGLFEFAWEVPGARSYLSGRGVGEETARRLEIGYDAEQHRVIFPVRSRDGQLYGFTGRAIDPGVNPKIRDYLGLPKRRLILGSHRWQGTHDARDQIDTDQCPEWWGWFGRPIILVEGLFAYAHLVELNVERVADVGALLGNHMTDEKAELLRYTNQTVVLLPDNDEGGEICLFGARTPGGVHSGGGAVDKLRDHVPLFLPLWPEGKDDPDQLTKAELWAMLTGTARDY